MVALFRSVRPDVVHLVTIKPVLYGGIAARLARVPAAVFAVSGLGYVFLAKGRRAWAQRQVVLQCYRVAFGHPNSRVIFQNTHDRDLFTAATGRAIAHAIVPGNGIDLAEFRSTPLPEGAPLVVLPARMLWDKGVGEFVQAARELRARGVNARFALVGPADGRNPSAIPEATLRSWTEEGIVEWWGMQTDMASVYATAAIVCLPSYREGMPRALIEAAACGRPVVTSDAPGCRDAIRPGVTGLLAKVRDAESLTGALRELLEDEPRRRQMGAAGRKLVETELAPDVVIGRVLALYDELLVSSRVA
jgi:glycosyltransferase involved in cell wall biosynthesis